jgi:hypothetical protein
MIVITLFACKNKAYDMIEYKNSETSLCFNVPSYMHKSKEDNSSMLFEGNGKFVNFMWNKSENGWDIDKFSQKMTKDSEGLTLVEKNDTLIVYEIHKGVVTMPALIFSLQERNGYSILVTTMGISRTNHQTITGSIK